MIGIGDVSSALELNLKHSNAADKQSCGPVAQPLQEMATMASSYVLMATTVRDGHRVLIFCAVCGAYAERQARKLCQECKIMPTGRGGPNLRRIERSLHPVEAVEIDGARPL